jgi:hypothetical protein
MEVMVELDSRRSLASAPQPEDSATPPPAGVAQSFADFCNKICQ